MSAIIRRRGIMAKPIVHWINPNRYYTQWEAKFVSNKFGIQTDELEIDFELVAHRGVGVQLIGSSAPIGSNYNQYAVSCDMDTWGIYRIGALSFNTGEYSNQQRYVSNVFNASQRYRVKLNSAGVYVDGALKASTGSGFTSQENTLLIDNGDIKIYGITHKRNGVLIHNYVPHYDNTNGVSYRDTIDNVIYPLNSPTATWG